MTHTLRRFMLAAASVLTLAAATPALAATELTVQRFFGACDAEFGTNTDASKAVGECGIITSLINKFNAANPDVHETVTTVEWPGYDQLTAQFAAGDPPDIVTIHHSVLGDYQSKGLLMPLDDLLTSVGVASSDFTDASLSGVTKDGRIYGFPTSAPDKEKEPVSRLAPLTGTAQLRWQTPDGRYWVEGRVLLADAQDHLSSSDMRDTQRIPPDGTPQGKTFELAHDGAIQHWVQSKNGCCGIYFTVNSCRPDLHKKARKDDVELLCAIWADLDAHEDAGREPGQIGLHRWLPWSRHWPQRASGQPYRS